MGSEYVMITVSRASAVPVLVPFVQFARATPVTAGATGSLLVVPAAAAVVLLPAASLVEAVYVRVLSLSEDRSSVADQEVPEDMACVGGTLLSMESSASSRALGKPGTHGGRPLGSHERPQRTFTGPQPQVSSSIARRPSAVAPVPSPFTREDCGASPRPSIRSHPKMTHVPVKEQDAEPSAVPAAGQITAPSVP